MKRHNAWGWIPTLYFAEGLPYFAVMSMAVIMYQNLGLSDGEIAFFTSWLGLPWMVKPVWSPFIDLLRTKRFWVLSMQSLLAAAFASVAFFLPTSCFVQGTMACFALMAFASATHDMAADGFYMLSLTEKEQSFFVGLRNTFYRCGSIFGQGVLVMTAGLLAEGKLIASLEGDTAAAWAIVFYLLAALFIALVATHSVTMPKPSADRCGTPQSARGVLRDFCRTFVTFFQKEGIGLTLFFILTYRLGESQLVKVAQLFVLASPERGGLGLTTTEVGLIYGTFGVIALLLGGIVAGYMVSRRGLKRWIIPMALAINLPDLLYVFLAWSQSNNLWVVTSCVVAEQFGYGVGFAAYMLYLIYIADGPYKTAHYAIATGLMAAGMMFPGMVAGYLAEALGYTRFFLVACLCTLPGIYAAAKVKQRLT